MISPHRKTCRGVRSPWSVVRSPFAKDYGLRTTGQRRGVSLLEALIALIVIGILVSLSVPSFQRALEQARANSAGANLRAIWSAQRLYWLEYRAYASDVSTLRSLNLLDPTLASGQGAYRYQIQAADAGTFTATATRASNGRWTGTFSIDNTGVVSGVVRAPGEQNLVPGFQ